MAQQATLQHQLSVLANAKQLRTVHDAIVSNLAEQPPGRKTGLEVLVACAEVATKLGSLSIAQDCLERYFLEVRRYGPGLAAVEVRDQYLCRAHFAAGLLVSERSKGLKGQALINGTLEAIKHIMSGLELAAANPRYLFLVYNASVHHWRAAAPLHRDGLRAHLLPSTDRVVQALEKVPGQEEWRVRCYVALALCQSDGGKADEAAKTLQKAYDTAAAAKLGELQRDVARLQAHQAAAAGGKGGKGGGGAPAAPKAAPGKGAPAPPPLDEEGALRAIQAALSARPDKAVAEQQLQEAVAKVDPKPDGPVKGALLRPVSRAAWAAAVLGLPELAEKWAGRAAASSDSGPRTWSEMTRVLLSLQALGPAGDSSLASTVVQAHVKALEVLEDALTTLTKLMDVDGIHAAARLAWNCGLLLLQPTLRRHVKRAFNAAARALAVAASPLTRLRASLHLEAAKCDAAEEALIKAAQEAVKALALDYLPTPAEAAAVPWLARPLDRWIVPLERTLALRTASEPTDPEEEAMSLIERSKESRNPAIRSDLLLRARDKIAGLPFPPAPTATEPPLGTPQRTEAHERARRRTCVWAELVRSASGVGAGAAIVSAAGGGSGSGPAPGLEAHVLAAVPYVTALEWSPAVDREMVLLQAQLSLAEAEAAVASLKRQRAEVASPLEPSPQGVDGNGVRLPPANVAQTQQLVGLAVVRAMRLALSVNEPWLVHNAAVLLYNAALPAMQQHHYADLYRMLRPAAEALLSLPADLADGPMTVALTEALAKSAEHRALLAASAAQASRAAGEEEDEPEDEDGEAWPHFKHGVSKGYAILPEARVAASGLHPKAFPSLAPLVSSLAGISSLCEAALGRAGGAGGQGLFEAHVRLGQLRGVSVGLAAAAAEQTSKVVSAIEVLAATAASATAGGAAPTEKAAAAVALLRALPGGPHLELWAKMARAAASAGCWPAALECSQAALAALPGSPPDLLSLESPSDLPEVPPAAWFWAAVSMHVQGSALLAVVDPARQSAAVALSMRHTALQHAAQAARFAGFLHKVDLVETACRLAWNCCLPFFPKPLLRAALTGPLGVAAEALNHTGAKDVEFQVRLNCLHVECLAGARRWGDAVAAVDAACRATAKTGKALHQPLVGWKAACLSQLGRPINAEMTRVKEHPQETQAHAWLVLSHHSACTYDQLAGQQAAVAAVGNAGWLRALSLGSYAEWLLSVTDDREAAEEVLLAAADSLLEFDTGDLDNDDDDDDGTFRSKSSSITNKGPAKQRSGNSVAARRSFMRVLSRGRTTSSEGRRPGTASGSADAAGGDVGGHLDPNLAPDELGTLWLDRLARLYVMAAQVASCAADHADYLLAAHHYYVRLASQALHSAASRAYHIASDAHMSALAAAAADNKEPPPEEPLPPPHAQLPDTLVGWGSWQLTAATVQQLEADAGSVCALDPGNLPQAAQTLAYLDLLQTNLRARGYHCHCLGLAQLQRLICKLALRDQGMYEAVSLGLASQLDELGLSDTAAALEQSLGDVATVPPQDEAAAKEAAGVAALVRAAETKLGVARPRSAHMMVGRLSFIAGGVRRAAAAAAGAAAPLAAPAATDCDDDAALGAAAPAARQAGGTRPGGSSSSNGVAGQDGMSVTVTVTAVGPAGGPLQLPAWLEEAARQLQGVDLGVQSATGGSCGLLSHVNGLLLLQPLTFHDAWLRKGEYLGRRGHYGAARDLLSRARAHASDCGNREAEARCLLALSRVELTANNPAEAITLVQAAQRLGGDIDFWCELLVQYVDSRMATNYTTTMDAREALQGGIAMFMTLARDDRSAEKAAAFAAAMLRVRLARLLLQTMANLRALGVSSWRKSYEQAASLVQQAIMALGAREAGVPHVEALLVQAELLQADPQAVKDLRPRLKKVEKLLLGTEELALKLLSEATPRDLDPRVTPPLARLVARVRCALAEVQLASAVERDRLAAADRDKARPKFPKVKGGKDVDVKVVVDFIDTVVEDGGAKPSLDPEDSALARATSGAALVASAPRDRAQALLVAGRCLLFKYMKATPPELQPTRRFEELISPADASAGVGNFDGSASAVGAAAAAAGADGSAAAGDAGPTTASPQPPGLEQLPPAAAGLQVQAAAALSSALQEAVSVQDWALAEAAAHELASCYGQLQPGLACRALAIAQGCKAAAGGQALLRAAAPPQHPEALCLAARDALSSALPSPAANVHYRTLRSVLDGVKGGCTARLAPAATVPEVEKQLGLLPGDLRLLLLYPSPDGAKLYVAALNLPDPAAPPAEQPQDKGGAKKKGDAPPPPGPKVCLLQQVELDMKELEGLAADFKTYRRSAERRIREVISAAAAKGIGVPQEEEEAEGVGAPAKKGGKKPPSPKKRPGSNSKQRGGKGGAATGQEAPKRVDIFDPEVNEEWRGLMDGFEAWLEPLRPLLEAALPALPASPPASPAGGKRGGAGGGKAGVDAGPPKYKVALLIDPSLDGLPWEALDHLKANCASVSRAPSLQSLAVAAASAAAAAADAPPPSGGGAAGPAFDLGHMSYIVDPKHECSTAQQARGQYMAQLVPTLKAEVLTSAPYAKDWQQGLMGAPARVPPLAQYAELLTAASSLLFLGVGRFAAHLLPEVLASADLSACDCVMVFDRCNTDAAYWAQLYRDNRKSAAARRMESPARVAALLLARGVKTVVVTSAAAPPAVACRLMKLVLEGVAAGQSVGEAAYGAVSALVKGGEYELEHLAAQLQVWGLPNMVGQVLAGGKGGAKKK